MIKECQECKSNFSVDNRNGKAGYIKSESYCRNCSIIVMQKLSNSDTSRGKPMSKTAGERNGASLDDEIIMEIPMDTIKIEWSE